LKKLKAPRAPADVFQRAAQDVQAVTLAVQHLKQEHSLAILLVEQYVDFCREVADRFYAMDRGAVVVSGEIATLTDDVVKKHLQV
jgi:urea transport system ATP-binding protein